MIATAASWKRLPLSEKKLPFPLAAHYSAKEFKLISSGFIPQSENDSWFIYYEEPWLYFHESKSGKCIYQIRFVSDHDGMTVSEAWRYQGNQESYGPNEQDHDSHLVSMAINALLHPRKSEKITLTAIHAENMSAKADSWKRKPFVGGSAIPYTAQFTEEEYARIREGLIPKVMEDKWFIYFESPHLFFHRSWTGDPMYRITFADTKQGASVFEAVWAYNAPAGEDKLKEQSLLLDFLVSNLLLKKSKPFPRPAGLHESMSSLYQHKFSGTGYSDLSNSDDTKPDEA